MLMPRDPGAIPARNFCGLVEAAAATDEEPLVDTKLAAANTPVDVKNDLR
jgi:hypothetical protein